jgi:hypothetical protein
LIDDAVAATASRSADRHDGDVVSQRQIEAVERRCESMTASITLAVAGDPAPLVLRAGCIVEALQTRDAMLGREAPGLGQRGGSFYQLTLPQARIWGSVASSAHTRLCELECVPQRVAMVETRRKPLLLLG